MEKYCGRWGTQNNPFGVRRGKEELKTTDIGVEYVVLRIAQLIGALRNYLYILLESCENE